ncbi:hypothetical protein K435DRAFT_737092, partial [Dendrothele bispora CBS 962.96]
MLNGVYDTTLRHAEMWKVAFDKRVLKQFCVEVAFQKGQIVQLYRNYTLKPERKLLPKWSQPRRVVKR